MDTRTEQERANHLSGTTVLRPIVGIAVAGMLLASCGSAEDEAADPGEPGVTAEPEPPGTDEPGLTEDPGEEPGDDLPGEAVDIYPYEGSVLGVVGVPVGDQLPVHAIPGDDAEVVTELDPLSTGMIATGHNRSLSESFWVELSVDGLTGWASVVNLAQPGQVADITSELDLPLEADTMEELADLVAEQRASEEPASTIEVVDGPHEGDLFEIIVDVVGMGDDSVLGERLHIFAVAEGEGYQVRTVESTLLCIRGVSEGLCL